MASFKQSLATLMVLLPLALSLHAEMEFLGRILDQKYKLVSSDNFDGVLQALGASYAIRALALVAKPVDSLTRAPNHYNVYTLTSKWTLFTMKETFRPDMPFKYETYDGRHVTALVSSFKPGVLHEVQEEEGGRITVIDRTFTRDQLKMVIRVGSVVSTRVYQALSRENSNDTHEK